MKKSMIILLTVMLSVALAACGSKKETAGSDAGSAASGENVTLTVGASPVPHAEILNVIKPILEKEGVTLIVKEFNDYIQPNVQLYEKQLDANFYQHTPYLDQFNKERGYDLVKAGGVHLEPIGAYSKKIKSADELKDGATVAIPNDATNGGRALLLLAANNVIKLKDGTGVEATVKDVTDNPKNLKFKELEAAMLPRVLDEVNLAVINTNFALEAKLDPAKDALFIEGKDSPYVNILVTRPDNKDSDAIRKLAKALNSDEVKAFINDQYKGSILPAF